MSDAIRDKEDEEFRMMREMSESPHPKLEEPKKPEELELLSDQDLERIAQVVYDRVMGEMRDLIDRMYSGLLSELHTQGSTTRGEIRSAQSSLSGALYTVQSEISRRIASRRY